MKNVAIFFTVLLLAVHAMGATTGASQATEYNFNKGEGFFRYSLGTQMIRDNYRNLRLQYDFTRQGGAIGTQTLAYAASPGITNRASFGTLPKNAIVVGCYIDVLVAPVGVGASIALSTGQTAADLKAATAIASYTGIVACIPVNTAASAIKLLNDVVPTVSISGAALTAGKFNVHIQYMLSDQ